MKISHIINQKTIQNIFFVLLTSFPFLLKAQTEEIIKSTIFGVQNIIIVDDFDKEEDEKSVFENNSDTLMMSEMKKEYIKSFEAYKLAKISYADLNEDQKNTIFIITDCKPTQINKIKGVIEGSSIGDIVQKYDITKVKGLAFHGSAGGDASLLSQEINHRDVNFGIMRKNGLIFQFEEIDSTHISGGLGPAAQGFSNFNTLGIEFSLNVLPKGTYPYDEVVDPNEYQLAAGLKLRNHLQETYNILDEDCTLSYLAVMGDNGLPVDNSCHTDTRSWLEKPEILEALGFDVEEIESRKRIPNIFFSEQEQEFLIQLLKDRIVYSEHFNKMYPQYKNQRPIKIAKEEIKKILSIDNDYLTNNINEIIIEE